jgi:hypothetical protein
MPKRAGRKSSAQTPSKPSERIKGSKVNKPKSASSKESASSIVLSDTIISALQKKADEYNEKHQSNKVTLSALKAVFRRGAGAFSNSHRPNMTRSGWAYARVNKFLEKKAGKKVKAAYVQDDDLLAKGGLLKEYNYYLQRLINNYGDEIRAKEELQWFISVLHDYNENGGEVYRIVSAQNKSKIDTKKLGKHWTFEKSNLSRIYENVILEDEKAKPYLITAISKKGTVDYESSLENFTQIPDEVEINFTETPIYKTATIYKQQDDDLLAKGGEIKLLAPNGNPSNLTAVQYELVRTPAFKAWFGDWENDPENASKVVDNNGEPLVVYHGTRKRGEKGIFSIFDIDKSGESNTVARVGFWFTPKESFAKNFADNTWWGRDTTFVYSTFLCIKNPKIYTTDNLPYGDSYEKFRSDIYEIEGQSKEKANIGGIGMALKNSKETIEKYRNNIISNGYDGIFIKDTRFDKREAGGINTQFVVLKSNQIKLANGNNTTFDGNNPDIRYAEGGLIAPNGKPSNLTPEQYKLVRTDAFKKWFGDWENDPENASNVVDENGEPLVNYRGQVVEEHLGYEFKKGFNLLKKPSKNEFGYFFTSSKDFAEGYADYPSSGKIGYVLDVFLSAKVLDLRGLGIKFDSGISYSKYLQKNGVKLSEETKEKLENIEEKYYKAGLAKGYQYDVWDIFDLIPEINNDLINSGFTGVVFYERYPIYSVYAVFESEQIKLADGTNTTFDGNNPDIRFDLGGDIRKHYDKEKIKGANEIEYQNLIKYGLKYDEDFLEKLNSNEKSIWLKLQDLDFENMPIDLPIKNIPIEDIIFSQSDIGINIIEKNKHKIGLPICIKKDGKIYIISGNHRLFSQLIKDKKNNIKCYLKNFDENKYAEGGEIEIFTEQPVKEDIICDNCGWTWVSDKVFDIDKYNCHKCNYDNTPHYININDMKLKEGGEIGLLAKGMTINDLARKHNVPVDVLKKQLEIGIEQEKEHTTNLEYAKAIALDHIFEYPFYYEELKKMESNIQKKIALPDSYSEYGRLSQILSNQGYELKTMSENTGNPTFEKEFKDGGVVVGKRHSEEDEFGTGERFVVESTGQVVEVEGGEGVLCADSMKSTKVFDFQGRKMTGKQIASLLNHKYGGVQFENGGRVNHICGCKSKYYHGGELPSATLHGLNGGEAVVTVKSMEAKDKFNFEGSKLTPREIFSIINEKSGGKKFEEGGVINLADTIKANNIKLLNMFQFVQKILYY